MRDDQVAVHTLMQSLSLVNLYPLLSRLAVILLFNQDKRRQIRSLHWTISESLHVLLALPRAERSFLVQHGADTSRPFVTFGM